MQNDDHSITPNNRSTTQNAGHIGPTLTEIAKSVCLPVAVVRRLQDLKVIGSPVTNDDVVFLKKYRRTWGNFYLLKNQLARLSKKQRNDILTRPELATKWERWVYSRFLYNEIEYGFGREMLTPQNRIKLDNMAEDLERIFNIPKSRRVMERVKKIREMAYNDRKKIGRDPQCEKEILLRRTRKKDRVDLETESYVFDMYS